MYYIYIIQSKNNKKHYTGITENLVKRLKAHNTGESKYTAKDRPYKFLWYCCFADKNKAYKFEKYLKTGSGIAFLKKHLI